jgi:hypothetical protein
LLHILYQFSENGLKCACFDPFLETPMAGLVWWILIGLTIALIGVAGFLARRALDADV